MRQATTSLSQVVLLCEVAIRQMGFVFLVGYSRAGRYMTASIVLLGSLALASAVTAGRAQFLWMASIVAATLGLAFWEAFIAQLWFMAAPRNLRFVPNMPFATAASAVLMLLLVSLVGMGFFFLQAWFYVAVLPLLGLLSVADQRARYSAIGAVLIGILAIAVCQLTIGNMSVWMRGDIISGVMFFVSAWEIVLCALALTGLARIRPLWGYPLWILWLTSIMFTPPIDTISIVNTLKFASKGDPALIGTLSASFSSLSEIAAEFSTQVVRHGLAALLACGLLIFCLTRFQPSDRGQVPRRAANLLAMPEFSAPSVRRKSFLHCLPGYDHALMRAARYQTKFSKLLPATFGRAAHWSTLCWAAAFHLAAILFLLNLIPASKQQSIQVLVIILMGIAFTPFAAMLPSALIRATFQTRREHRLLSLAPKWPESRRALNRYLAWHFARYCGVVVALGLVFVIVLAMAYQIELAAIWRQIIAVLLIGPLLFAAVLRNYTKMTTPNLGFEAIFWALLMMLPSVLMTLAYAELAHPAWVLLTIFATSLIFAYARYQRFIALPAALPAGQLTN